MTTILSTPARIYRISFFFLLLLSISSQTVWGQSIQKSVDKVGNDSTQLSVEGYPDVTPPAKDSALDTHFEYFWILGNGNFIPNTRSNAIQERYYNSNPTGTTGAENYEVKVYSTSIYMDLDDEPTKTILTDTITPTAEVPEVPAATNAVKSDYLNLQFNHNEIIPGDTTLWVISIKNPVPDSISDGFSGEVYLFFNSPVKVYTASTELADNNEAVRTKKVGLQELVAEKNVTDEVKRPNFKYNTSFIYNDNFIPVAFDVSGAFKYNESIAEAYEDGLLWHLNFLPGESEQHLFIEFQDADNIFKNERDSETRVVDFLAVLAVDQDLIQPADFSDEKLALISSLELEDFTNYLSTVMSDSNTITGNILPNPLQHDLQTLNKRIIDITVVESKIKRAHDPNALTIKACSCPPNSSGAQKLVLTVEFENDGEAPTTEVEVRIPIPNEIDAASITGDLLAFYGPGLNEEGITLSFTPDNKTMIWSFSNLQLHGTKYLGAGHPDTYGQFTFTALTTAGLNINDIPKMHACIFFSDKHGDLAPICTRAVKPTGLSEAESKNEGVQYLLSCENCDITTSHSSDFPIWLICLIVAVVLFAMWIGLYKDEDE